MIQWYIQEKGVDAMISIEHRNGKAILVMSRERGNAINSQMVVELRDAFRNALHDTSVKGIILTGSNGYFSAGLDIPELYQCHPDEFERFWWNYSALIEELVALRKPYIAAITGHAPGAGCMLALCADYRLMADGSFTIGLNEVASGIVMPESFGALLAGVVGSNKAFNMIMDAAVICARDAFAAGMVDELAPTEDVVDRAVAKMDRWLAYSYDTWCKSKYNLRQPLCEIFAQDFRKLYGETIRTWWSPETRTILENIHMATAKSR